MHSSRCALCACVCVRDSHCHCALAFASRCISEDSRCCVRGPPASLPRVAAKRPGTTLSLANWYGNWYIRLRVLLYELYCIPCTTVRSYSCCTVSYTDYCRVSCTVLTVGILYRLLYITVIFVFACTPRTHRTPSVLSADSRATPVAVPRPPGPAVGPCRHRRWSSSRVCHRRSRTHNCRPGLPPTPAPDRAVRAL